MTGIEIRRGVKRRVYQLRKRYGIDCHVSVSGTTTGECHILFATTPHLAEAKRIVLGWAYRQVPVEAVERHLAALDRKIQQLQDGVMD